MSRGYVRERRRPPPLCAARDQRERCRLQTNAVFHRAELTATRADCDERGRKGEGTKFTTVDHGLKSVTEPYSRSRGPPFVRPNSRRVFGHSNTRSTTPSPPRICACEGASKQVDQRGRHAVPVLQLSRHNAMPPTCASQSLQTDERRRARRGERTETQAWADAGVFRHTRRQRTHTCRVSVVAIPVTVIGGGDNCQICGMHARGC